MLPSFCTDEVTVYRAPLVDSRGTQVRDWAQEESHTVSGCSFQFATSSTTWSDTRQTATIRARLFVPYGSDIQQDDCIGFYGNRYAIDGAPMPRRSPTGAVTHTVLNLIDWRG